MKLRELDERELERLYQSDQDVDFSQEPEVSRNLQRKRINRQRGQLCIGPMIMLALVVIIFVLLLVYIVMAVTQNDDRGKEALAGVKQTYSLEEVNLMVADAIEGAKAEEAERILNGIKQNLTDGMAVAKALRPYYPDEVVIATGGRIRFFPIQESVRKNNYSEENLVQLDNGELQYKENGQVITRKGIDVSYHQGEIDWQLVAQDGVEFAILRVGIRGYGTGKLVVDEQFENNIKGALSNGIQVGVYFYSQSVNEAEVLEEAQVVLDQIAPYKVTGPVVYDAEKVTNARTSNLTMEERTAMAIAFCEKMKEAGYDPMIYVNLEAAFSMLDMTQLEEYDKWLAHYTTDMYYPYEYSMWQYSEKGKVQGISTDVDMNISFETWE